jgi:hypothetical protein
MQKPPDPRGLRPRIVDPAKALERLAFVAAYAFTALPEPMRRKRLLRSFLLPRKFPYNPDLVWAIKPVYSTSYDKDLSIDARRELWAQFYHDDLEIVTTFIHRQAADWLGEALASNRAIVRQLREEFLGGPTPEHLYQIARYLRPARDPDPAGASDLIPEDQRREGYERAMTHINPEHLGIILAQPDQQSLLDALGWGYDDRSARRVLERKFAQAEAAIHEFEAEIKQNPEHLWRYHLVISAGLARALESVGSPLTPAGSNLLRRFILEIGRLKLEDPVDAMLLVTGLVLTVAAIALSGGALGALVASADLAFGAYASVDQAYQGYLRERQNAYAENATALKQGVPLSDRPADFSNVFLGAAGALICGYFLARGSFHLLQGVRREVAVGRSPISESQERLQSVRKTGGSAPETADTGVQRRPPAQATDSAENTQHGQVGTRAVEPEDRALSRSPVSEPHEKAESARKTASPGKRVARKSASTIPAPSYTEALFEKRGYEVHWRGRGTVMYITPSGLLVGTHRSLLRFKKSKAGSAYKGWDSHHIVEETDLVSLGIRRRFPSRDELPCVLLPAPGHEQRVGDILSRSRGYSNPKDVFDAYEEAYDLLDYTGETSKKELLAIVREMLGM